MTISLRVLSLGAGVQSTTLALMAAHGELEPPDCAIFADTQAEPASVYEHLRWLMSPGVLPFPVHIVTARDWWQRNRWPLIEIGMTRRGCLGWLDRRGYPHPPKSACTFCPFRNTEHWKLLRARDPKAFADAVAIDELIRPGLPREKHPQPLFVHHSRKPLSEIDFMTADERGQPDLFGNECSGVCGV